MTPLYIFACNKWMHRQISSSFSHRNCLGVNLVCNLEFCYPFSRFCTFVYLLSLKLHSAWGDNVYIVVYNSAGMIISAVDFLLFEKHLWSCWRGWKRNPVCRRCNKCHQYDHDHCCGMFPVVKSCALLFIKLYR